MEHNFLKFLFILFVGLNILYYVIEICGFAFVFYCPYSNWENICVFLIDFQDFF